MSEVSGYEPHGSEPLPFSEPENIPEPTPDSQLVGSLTAKALAPGDVFTEINHQQNQVVFTRPDGLKYAITPQPVAPDLAATNQKQAADTLHLPGGYTLLSQDEKSGLLTFKDPNQQTVSISKEKLLRARNASEAAGIIQDNFNPMGFAPENFKPEQPPTVEKQLNVIARHSGDVVVAFDVNTRLATLQSLDGTQYTAQAVFAEDSKAPEGKPQNLSTVTESLTTLTDMTTLKNALQALAANEHTWFYAPEGKDTTAAQTLDRINAIEKVISGPTPITNTQKEIIKQNISRIPTENDLDLVALHLISNRIADGKLNVYAFTGDFKVVDRYNKKFPRVKK